MDATINSYGDAGVFIARGCGADIATQRADDLDQECLDFLRRFQHPLAIDVACGAGGQATRMALAGALVLAIDRHDLSSEVRAHAAANRVRGRVRFMQRDLRDLDSLRQHGLAQVVISQRAIHYVKFQEAVEAVKAMGRMLRPEGRLYLSASGLHSELGEGYAAGQLPIETRWASLSAAMQDKHGIHGEVCLYSVEDMRELLRAGGMIVETLFASAFGNVKAVARLG